jgi:D-alanine-D-alanine ligase
VSSTKQRVALVYGGRSAEHSVSVVSARSVMEALDPERFEVVPVAITREGAWLLPASSPAELSTGAQGLPVVGSEGTPVALHPGRGATALDADALGAIDVVFPLLHGPFGEDGTVQGLLELVDLPYVGSGVLASALAMDKAMAKVAFAQAGLPQPPYLVLQESGWRARMDEVRREVGERLGWPAFTKPARLGSSIGISKVDGPDALEAAIAAAFAYDDKVLVERGLVARELECGVIGLDRPEASVVGEIVPAHDFYDFEAKYLDESKLLIPAPVGEKVAERVRELALRAYGVLGCEGFARVDFFYEEATGNVLLNEVNTIPGFTPKSMFPMLWQASGLPYADLIARLVELAVERHERRRR